MKNRWSLTALLLGGAMVLGAAVLRVPIASAAQSITAAITSPLDANGNVAVHEQGTANVNVVNTPTVTLGDTETVLLFDSEVASGPNARGAPRLPIYDGCPRDGSDPA